MWKVEIGRAVCANCADMANVRKLRQKLSKDMEPADVEKAIIQDLGTLCAYLGCEGFYSAPYCVSCLHGVIKAVEEVERELEVS